VVYLGSQTVSSPLGLVPAHGTFKHANWQQDAIH